MKKTTRKVAVLLLLLGGMLCQAQEIPDVKKALITARFQLFKSSPTYNPENAIVVYTQLATQGNAEAMNALGMIYSKGIGVTIDETLGIEWFEKAANVGYAKSWYNLGQLYKDNDAVKAINYFERAANSGYATAYAAWGRILMTGEGVAQNYRQAVTVFKEGTEKGNAYCNYALGYLYYKGFGAAQDYALAIEHFEIAAQKKQPWAMYMLGLCYRNGYGVTIDLEKAKFWLNKSASIGVKPSQMELADPEAENEYPNQSKTVSKPIDEIISVTETDVPKTFKKVKQAAINTNISGNYTGTILRYDWSGQNIISNTPITIDLNQDKKQLTGVWKEEAGDTINFNAEIQENAITFKDTKIDRTEHFYKGGLNSYEFKKAQLQLIQTPESLFLIGNLQLYNIKERENEKPIYLIVEKKNRGTEITSESEILSRVIVYPNPFISNFELSFDLVQNMDVTASIYSITGNQLYTTQWKNLEQGTQKKSINLNVPSGYYILHLNYGQQVKTAILIKQ
ncbi:MAG: hypothetical protein RLZZ540_2008 [Bacteroidota bacterium]|jgi:hypothetical protein